MWVKPMLPDLEGVCCTVIWRHMGCWCKSDIFASRDM